MMVSYFILLVALFYLNIRFFFAFMIFYIEKGSFIDAMKRSWLLTQKHVFLIFRITALITLYTFLAMAVILLLTLLPLFLVDTYLPSYARIANSLCSTAFFFLTMILVSLSSIALTQAIVVTYHQLNNTALVEKRETYRPKRSRWFINFALILAYGTFSIIIYFDSPNPDLLGDVFIVSHRGESVLAIENTLESLRIASSHHPDYVEMDVQQLADGTLVVFHDTDLKRLAGINRRLNTYSFDELNQDVTLSSNGFEAKIPSLDEYLALAKHLNQHLMIEIKTNSSDSTSFLSQVHELVDKHDMTNKTIFQSLDKTAILEYKDRYPESTVGFILGINIGGLEDLNVDFFSLEDFSLTPRVVREAQRMRKGLFVWTVNDDALMQTYFKTEVSGIITDNVPLANAVRVQMKSNSLSDLFWDFNIRFD